MFNKFAPRRFPSLNTIINRTFTFTFTFRSVIHSNNSFHPIPLITSAMPRRSFKTDANNHRNHKPNKPNRNNKKSRPASSSPDVKIPKFPAMKPISSYYSLLTEPVMNSKLKYIDSKSFEKFPKKSPSLNMNMNIPYLTALSHEIYDFSTELNSISHSRVRLDSLKLFDSHVQSIFNGEVTVSPFGSFITGLSLPHSDIDIALLTADGEDKIRPLRKLMRSLQKLKSKPYKEFELIPWARVPILRLTDSNSHVSMDISIDSSSTGSLGVEFVDHFNSIYPSFRPLILIIKQLLYRIGLNETFSGGFSSYSIQLLILFYLQLHEISHSGHKESNLGLLLIGFFEFYGFLFNYHDDGIRIGGIGNSHNQYPEIYSKLTRGFYNESKPWLLSIENPLDPNHRDCTGGSFHIQRIQRAFQLASQILSNQSESLKSNDSYMKLLNSHEKNKKPTTLNGIKVGPLLTQLFDPDVYYTSEFENNDKNRPVPDIDPERDEEIDDEENDDEEEEIDAADDSESMEIEEKNSSNM